MSDFLVPRCVVEQPGGLLEMESRITNGFGNDVQCPNGTAEVRVKAITPIRRN